MQTLPGLEVNMMHSPGCGRMALIGHLLFGVKTTRRQAIVSDYCIEMELTANGSPSPEIMSMLLYVKMNQMKATGEYGEIGENAPRIVDQAFKHGQEPALFLKLAIMDPALGLTLKLKVKRIPYFLV